MRKRENESLRNGYPVAVPMMVAVVEDPAAAAASVGLEVIADSAAVAAEVDLAAADEAVEVALEVVPAEVVGTMHRP